MTRDEVLKKINESMDLVEAIRFETHILVKELDRGGRPTNSKIHFRLKMAKDRLDELEKIYETLCAAKGIIEKRIVR